MKWIKYKIFQNVIDNLPVLIDKKVGHSEDNLTIAQKEAYNGEYTIEEDEQTFEKEPLAIEFGGTGQKDVKSIKKFFSIPDLNTPPTQENVTLTGGAGYYMGSITTYSQLDGFDIVIPIPLFYWEPGAITAFYIEDIVIVIEGETGLATVNDNGSGRTIKKTSIHCVYSLSK